MGFLLFHTILWSASLIVLAVCAGTDLKDRLIPNELVIVIAAIGLAQGLVLRPEQIWFSLLGAFIVFCGLGLIAHCKIIGGGDLKLMSAVAFLVPPDRVGQLLIEIALAGGLLSCFYLAAHHALRRSLHASQTTPVEDPPLENSVVRMIKTERARIAAGDSLPYALAVLGGVSIYVAKELLQ